MTKIKNFLIVVFILVLLAIGNIYFYIGRSRVRVTGFSIAEFGSKIIALDMSTIIFLVQWLLLLVVVFIFYVRFLKNKREEAKKNKILPRNVVTKRNTGTDLDTLYDVLQKKKILKLSTIGKSFGIDNEKALEWARMLENNDLVNIEYPAFSEPEVNLKRGVDEKQEKEVKEKTQQEKEGKKEKTSNKKQEKTSKKARKKKAKKKK